MPHTRKSHKETGKALRKLGVLPKGYNLAHLTKNQKDRIRKLERKFSQEVKHPEAYTPKRLSRKSAADLGFSRKQQTVLIPTYGARRVRVEKTGRVVREFKSYKTITLTQRGQDVHAMAELFFENKRKGEYLMLRAGKHNPQGMLIASMSDFNAYVTVLTERVRNEATRYGTDPNKAVSEVFNQLYIVVRKDNDEDDDGED